MVLQATLCSSGRLALQRTGHRCETGDFYVHLGLLHCPQLLLNGIAPPQITGARTFWWSKTTTTERGPVAVPPAKVASLDTTNCECNAKIEPAGIPSDPVAASAVTSTDAGLAPPESGTLVISTSNQTSTPSDITEMTNMIPPLHHGDFYDLGLVSWWSPAGWVRYSMEVLHVATGMPWFYVMVAGTVVWRLAASKLTIVATRSASRLRPHAAELRALDEQAQHADQAAKMEIILKKRKIMEKSGVGMLSTVGAPLGQLVIQLGLFLGVKKMVTLPVMQLQDSGVWFMPDLTVAGSYYIMPFVVASLANLQLMLQKKDLDASRPEMAHVFNVLRVVSFAFAPFMGAYPDGLWLSVATGLVVSIVQTRLLQIPSIRAKFGIAPITATLPPVSIAETFSTIIRYVKQQWKERVQPQALPGQKLVKSKSGKRSRR
ncbi:hypothetical protein ID866_2781 [Astraeus odoratus]|nr:hypothetical protein ID866_2781 [Astraeus odoratus]